MTNNRILRGILAAALAGAVIFTSGCGGKAEKGDAAQDDISVLEDGTLEGTVFTNRWADFVITFPDKTEFWSREDLKEQEERIMESNPALEVFKYDFAAIVDGENIFELTYESIPDGSTLDGYVKEMEESLTEAGYSIVEKGTINLAGSEYSLIRSKMEMVEASFGYDYYIRQVDDTYMCLTVFYRMNDKEMVRAVLSGMKPWNQK